MIGFRGLWRCIAASFISLWGWFVLSGIAVCVGFLGKNGFFEGLSSIYAELIYDLGLIIGPVTFIGLLSNYFLENNALKHFKDFLEEVIRPTSRVVDGMKKDGELQNILEATEQTLYVIGVCPLNVQMKQTEWMISKLEQLNEVKILILDPRSEGAKARETQSEGCSKIEDERKVYEPKLKAVFTKTKDRRSIEIKEYKIVPSFFLCISDDKTIYSFEYPIGEDGAEVPALIRQDSTGNNEDFKQALKNYKNIFNNLWTHSSTQEYVI